MNKKRRKEVDEDDDEDSDPWDQFSEQQSYDNIFNRGSKRSRASSPPPESVSEEPTEENWCDNEPPISSNDNAPPSYVVPVPGSDKMTIKKGCPLCNAQVGIRVGGEYTLKSNAFIDRILFDATFFSNPMQMYQSIANIMNTKVREELRDCYRVYLLDSTDVQAMLHFTKCVLDPALDVHTFTIQSRSMVHETYNDRLKEDPITKKLVPNYTAFKEWRAQIKTHFTISSYDVTKANGYRPGATAANANRIKASLVQQTLTNE